MRIAYLIIVHKLPEQINKLIKQLINYGECDIYIHIDKKNINIANEINQNENVFIYSQYHVRWGSFEIIKAAIFLMRKAIESRNKYSHIYFGSGQDLIIKDGLYDFLAENRENIFMKIHGEITNKNRASARYRIKWPQKLMIRNDWHIYRLIRILIQMLCVLGIRIYPNNKTYNANIRYYHGRTWFIAPFSVIDYIISFIDNNPDFVDFWNDSLASDLMFFQTIIMNSDYANKVKDELMYVKFGKTFGTMNHPLIICQKNIKEIEKSGFYFARKFDWNVDNKVIEYFIRQKK